MRALLPALAVTLAMACLVHAQSPPDPFADVKPADVAATKPAQEPSRSWMTKLFGDNFGFRKEVMSQFDVSGIGDGGRGASRQSLGFEALKKFSDSTSTIASFDFQARLVRRDGFNPVMDDMMGASRAGWSFEYHNLYIDLYNVFNPLLGDAQRNRNVGRFNFRAGHFYVPFGLNLQTDTHGTFLQLSNERNFGFERDWYTGFWGAINRDLNYDLNYLAGSGYDLKFGGQSGLGALRVSLSNKYSSQYGLEGGVSVMGGERLADFGGEQTGGTSRVVETRRIGIDARYRRPAPSGSLAFTTEISGGRDDRQSVAMQLYQAEYLRASRRWGVSTQYRRFTQATASPDAYITNEFAWYFKNDVGNSSVHSIRFDVTSGTSTVVALQYYFYR